MRETKFIKKNEKYWRNFEAILKEKSSKAPKLSEFYIKLTDDLSYARTFYSNRSVKVYLNQLVQEVFRRIYSGKQNYLRQAQDFWSTKLPLLARDARKSMMLALLTFLGAILIGYFSASADPQFSEVILGRSYVEETKANIAAGDPMAIYKERGEFNMFLGITLNNITVALITFAAGLFFAIGTLGILLRNGVMFGTFLHLFAEAGHFNESLITVMMHGILELSSIIIAGAAGLTLGSGLIFPGSLKRLRAFQISARRSISLLLGTIPLLILAGFIESYFTRYTDTANTIRIAIILLCLCFVMFYYWWYPRYISKYKKTKKENILEPDRKIIIKLDEIKSIGDIYFESFLIIRHYINQILLLSFIGSTFFCAVFFYFADGNSINSIITFETGLFSTTLSIQEIIFKPSNPIGTVLWLVCTIIIITCVLNFFLKKNNIRPRSFRDIFVTTALLVVMSGFLILVILNITIMAPTLLLIVPFLLLVYYSISIEGSTMFSSILVAIKLFRTGFTMIIGLSVSLLLSSVLFLLLPDTNIMQIAIETITTNVSANQQAMSDIYTLLRTWFTVALLFILTILWLIAYMLMYYSAKEMLFGSALYDKLEQIGHRTKIKGIDKE